MLALAVVLRRLRAFRRVAWHKLTGRWPRYRYCPAEGCEPLLGAGEREAFRHLAASWRDPRRVAPEPGYGRRPR